MDVEYSSIQQNANENDNRERCEKRKRVDEFSDPNEREVKKFCCDVQSMVISETPSLFSNTARSTTSSFQSTINSNFPGTNFSHSALSQNFPSNLPSHFYNSNNTNSSNNNSFYQTKAESLTIDSNQSMYMSSIIIFIRTLTGRILEIEANPQDTVLGLKERIQMRDGIPPSNQRLVFQGKAISDSQILQSTLTYRITHGECKSEPYTFNSGDPVTLQIFKFCGPLGVKNSDKTLMFWKKLEDESEHEKYETKYEGWGLITTPNNMKLKLFEFIKDGSQVLLEKYEPQHGWLFSGHVLPSPAINIPNMLQFSPSEDRHEPSRPPSHNQVVRHALNRKTREEEEEEELQRAIALSLQMAESPINYRDDDYDPYPTHVPSPSPAAGVKAGARAHDSDDEGYSQKSTKSRKVNGDSRPNNNSATTAQNGDYLMKGPNTQKDTKFPIEIIPINIDDLYLTENEAKEAFSFKQREIYYTEMEDDDYDLYNCGISSAIQGMRMLHQGSDDDDEEYGC